MQRSIKTKTKDDVSPEEKADVKEFYANKKDRKISSLEELIKELDK